MFKRIKDRLAGKPTVQSGPVMQAQDKDAPRLQHYMFAHRILPFLFFDNPELFLKIMSNRKGVDFLRMQWNNLSKHVKIVEPPKLLDYETRKLDDGTTIIIVTMPTPHKVTEAYFAAIVYNPSKADKPALVRYFILEYGKSVDPEHPKRTVLGEWTPQKQHINYGGNFTATHTEFLQSISEKLTQPVGFEAHAITSPRQE